MAGNYPPRRDALRKLRAKARNQGSNSKREVTTTRNAWAPTQTKTHRVEKIPDIKVTFDKLTIYRIEHPESKQGPFTHQTGRGIFASDAMVYLKEPQDMCKSLRSGSGYHYSFLTLGHLDMAINSYVLLRECGFHITVYESNEHIVLPDGQVAFDKDKSTCITSHEIHEFPFENYI